MARKPPFVVVSDTDSGVQPPRKLGPHGQALWDRIQAEFRIDDAGGIEVLAQACAMLDRAESCAEIIAAEGPLLRGRSGPKANPLVAQEIAARGHIARMLDKLGVNFESTRNPGRPPKSFGWKGPAQE